MAGSVRSQGMHETIGENDRPSHFHIQSSRESDCLPGLLQGGAGPGVDRCRDRWIPQGGIPQVGRGPRSRLRELQGQALHSVRASIFILEQLYPTSRYNPNASREPITRVGHSRLRVCEGSVVGRAHWGESRNGSMHEHDAKHHVGDEDHGHLANVENVGRYGEKSFNGVRRHPRGNLQRSEVQRPGHASDEVVEDVQAQGQRKQPACPQQPTRCRGQFGEVPFAGAAVQPRRSKTRDCRRTDSVAGQRRVVIGALPHLAERWHMIGVIAARVEVAHSFLAGAFFAAAFLAVPLTRLPRWRPLSRLGGRLLGCRPRCRNLLGGRLLGCRPRRRNLLGGRLLGCRPRCRNLLGGRLLGCRPRCRNLLCTGLLDGRLLSAGAFLAAAFLAPETRRGLAAPPLIWSENSEIGVRRVCQRL